MSRSGFLFTLLFVCVLVAGLVAFAPLSFLMRQSGMAGQGLGWQQARGTIWHGQVTGLSWQGEALGAVSLDANFWRVLRGGPSHAAQWKGPLGQGRALIKLGGDGAAAQDISISLPLAEGFGIDPQIARLGATVRLTGGEVAYRAGACTKASGKVTSDLATQAAAMFGRDWPLLTGSLTCQEGALHADLSGKAEDGTDIVLDANPLTGLRIDIASNDNEVRNALLAAGFKADGSKLTFFHAANGQETQP